MQMPNLRWTNLSSTHISLPPTSCLVKSSKISSALMMVLSNFLEDYWCMAKYGKDSLGEKNPTVVSLCINRETCNYLWLCLETANSPTEKGGLQTTTERPEIFCLFYVPYCFWESINSPDDLVNFYPWQSVIRKHPKVRTGEKYICQPEHREFCPLWQSSNTWEWQIKNSGQKKICFRLFFVKFQGSNGVTKAQKYLTLAEAPGTQHGFAVHHI